MGGFGARDARLQRDSVRFFHGFPRRHFRTCRARTVAATAVLAAGSPRRWAVLPDELLKGHGRRGWVGFGQRPRKVCEGVVCEQRV